MRNHWKNIFYLIITIGVSTACSSSTNIILEKKHERILNKSFSGDTLSISNFFNEPIEIYLPKNFSPQADYSLLIHFHGASYVPKAAVESVNENIVLAVVNLGIGSSVYEKPFFDKSTFPKLIDTIYSCLQSNYQIKNKITKTFLTSFSAGYGAVRRILQYHENTIDGVILMDGMHTDYVPDGVELSKGGRLNTEKLDLYLPLAESAISSKKIFIISHSDIYPATYASNKETSDYIIKKLNLERKANNKINLIGMHQTSEVCAGKFFVLGFDGNSAKDHVDHYHAMPFYLCKLFDCKYFLIPDFMKQ